MIEENNSLLIMAGGASSRMKRSLKNSSVGEVIKKQAIAVHKSLISLGSNQRPLLYYLTRNAEAAGYRNIYIITNPENKAFHIQTEKWTEHKIFSNVNIFFALQHVPESRRKPLGTADAVQQALEQHPELMRTTFTVCNGDNLYSTKVLKMLRSSRKVPHALISYARSGLTFSDERISKFAVMEIDSEHFLKNIVEKPDPLDVDCYKDSTNEIRVSMNIFSFNGALLYPFLKSCPIHFERDEKELPEALRLMNSSTPKKTICLPVSEHIPDLTSADDILKFEEE